MPGTRRRHRARPSHRGACRDADRRIVTHVVGIVSIVPGDGLLVRRPAAVFFSPVAPDDESVAALLLAFESASDDGSAERRCHRGRGRRRLRRRPVRGRHVDGRARAGRARRRRGDARITRRSRCCRVPDPVRGSSAGSARSTAPSRSASAVPSTTAPTSPLGRVRAGGFAAIVTAGRSPNARSRRRRRQPARPAAAASRDRCRRRELGRRLEGLAALRAATGGDWMEESLGLGPPGAMSDASAALGRRSIVRPHRRGVHRRRRRRGHAGRRRRAAAGGDRHAAAWPGDGDDRGPDRGDRDSDPRHFSR